MNEQNEINISNEIIELGKHLIVLGLAWGKCEDLGEFNDLHNELDNLTQDLIRLNGGQ